MNLNYSKWDGIIDSDDEEDVEDPPKMKQAKLLRQEAKNMLSINQRDRAKGCYTAVVQHAQQLAKEGGLLAEEATEMEHGSQAKLAEIAQSKGRHEEASHPCQTLPSVALTLPHQQNTAASGD